MTITHERLLEALVAARMHAGLTQELVARRMRTGQAYVARLESGVVEPRLGTLLRYLDAVDARLKVMPK